jgi:hypothetical protein
MPQKVQQGLQAVAQQLMQSLLAPGTKPQLPSFAGQEQALQSAYQSKLRAIEGGLADSKSSLEDKYFQNYLAARQAMANRGLAGSGLASDQDTRLLLAKQKDLAGIERDAARGKLDAADWLGGAQASLADKEYNAQQEALANASKGRAENLKTLSSFISQMMPYEQATVAEQMKNQLGYDQLDQDTRNFLDTLDFKYADLGQRATDNAADRTLKWVNTMGYDQDGNLTENSRHNRTTEALTDQGQKLNYNAKMAGIQAGLQKAAMAGARASSSGSGPKPTQSDRDRMIGQEDIEIFLRNIDLSKDSRSSSQKLIDQARAGRKIDAEGYKILTAANSAFWDEQDNRKAAIASAGEDEYRAGQHASEASFNDATDSSTIPLYVDDPYGIYGN